MADLRQLGLDRTRARKGAVRPELTPSQIRGLLADVATGGGVPFIDAASQAAQGNYGQAAVSGLLDAPPVKMAGMALAPLIGMVRKAAPMDEALRIAQKNAAKPVSEGGLGLPPDNTPMDRARAMGRDVPAYHATNVKDIYAFDPELASSSSRFGPASYFSGGDKKTLDVFAKEDGVVYPVLLPKQSIKTDSSLTKKQINDIFSSIKTKRFDNGYDASQDQKRIYDEAISNPENALDAIIGRSHFFDKKEYLSGLKKAGIDVLGRNVYGHPEYAVINPSSVRSRFAAFDPARINENNLLASLAALGISVPVMRGLLQEEEMQ